MMLKLWQRRLAAILMVLALALYAVRWFAFPDEALRNEMVRFLVGDIGFLFLQVLIVTLVLDSLIRRRERDEMRHKLNMVIGAFFTATGTGLLGRIARADAKLAEVRADLIPTAEWTARDYERSQQLFREHSPQIDLVPCDLQGLRDALATERSFIIGLLSNQALMEHETFSDLLWALTHLGEELSARTSLDALSPADAAHLAVDVRRVYTLLGFEWLEYLRHLQHAYPFLFSLAVRTNPLDPSAHVEIAE